MKLIIYQIPSVDFTQIARSPCSLARPIELFHRQGYFSRRTKEILMDTLMDIAIRHHLNNHCMWTLVYLVSGFCQYKKIGMLLTINAASHVENVRFLRAFAILQAKL